MTPWARMEPHANRYVAGRCQAEGVDTLQSMWLVSNTLSDEDRRLRFEVASAPAPSPDDGGLDGVVLRLNGSERIVTLHEDGRDCYQVEW